MRERAKRALVESYIGAIALGYVLAEAIFAFANIFASPVENWVEQVDYQRLTRVQFPSAHLQFHEAWPPLLRCILYLLLGYALFRWLYFEPVASNRVEPTTTPQETLDPR